MVEMLEVLPLHIWIYIAVAALLMVVAFALTWARSRRDAYLRAREALRSRPVPKVPEGSVAEVFEPMVRGGTTVLRCRAELLERRPLSEAQWDSEVPAAWTIFRLSLADSSGSAANLGLLLPIQEPKAFSTGYLERLDESNAEPLLQALSRALAGPVPPSAAVASGSGFLEFKTYVDNEKPQVVPYNLDMDAADYWIMVKIFIEDRLEFFMRINAKQGLAEIATSTPGHGEELMKVIAGTLRPEVKAT